MIITKYNKSLETEEQEKFMQQYAMMIKRNMLPKL